MYLEKQLLIKQVGKKKLSTQIKNGEINLSNLEALTQKESDLIFSSQPYKDFEKLVHNKEILQEVVYQTKFLLNTIEATNLLNNESNPFKRGTHLYRQGDFLQ
jgi:hypothetical protein